MCYSPITSRLHNGRVVTYPCGKCLECVSKYQNDWTFRIDAESRNWQYCYFLTLTYDNAHLLTVSGHSPHLVEHVKTMLERLPASDALGTARARTYIYSEYLKPERFCMSTPVPTVSLDHVQRYLKKCRQSYFREFNKEPELKYFLCSEYGCKTLRPHYHVFFMTNLNLRDFTLHFVNKWHFGSVDWKRKPLEIDAKDGLSAPAAYVAKYCCKPVRYENPFVLLGIVEKPFRLMSKGIGKSERDNIKRSIRQNMPAQFKGRGKYDNSPSSVCGYSEEYLAYLNKQLRIYKDGYFYSMPRYWRDAVYPKRKKVYRRYIKDSSSGCYHVRPVIRVVNSDSSPLLLAYQNYVQREYLRSMVEAAGFSFDPDSPELIGLLCRNILANNRERYLRKAKSFEKFYSRSVC